MAPRMRKSKAGLRKQQQGVDEDTNIITTEEGAYSQL
jgi:hypothetical protein